MSQRPRTWVIRFCKFRAVRSWGTEEKKNLKLYHLPSGHPGCFRRTLTSERKFHWWVPTNAKKVAAAQRSFDGRKIQQGWEGTSEHTFQNFVFGILVAPSTMVPFLQVHYLESKEQYFRLLFKVPPTVVLTHSKRNFRVCVRGKKTCV